ncbi:MAG: DUF4402 domain-containing protein [Sphingobacteriales bacterium]|nr:MAG: DUF4402 domain-containing protein [Sphingobacteriales bacterium]
MKKVNMISKVFGIMAVALMGFAGSAYAQPQTSTDVATATATIVQPILITKNTNMNFGNLSLNGGTGHTGTIILSATPTATRANSGYLTLPASVGTVTAAKFTVTGADAYAYNVTLPTTIDLANGTHDLVLSSFTVLNATGGTSFASTLAGQEIYVGATLTADGTEPAGVYTTATPFSVTVQYQ